MDQTGSSCSHVLCGGSDVRTGDVRTQKPDITGVSAGSCLDSEVGTMTHLERVILQYRGLLMLIRVAHGDDNGTVDAQDKGLLG